MLKFVVEIYNAEVRKLVEVGERHRRFNDDWAEIQRIAVDAISEAHARAKVEILHPSAQGFVQGDIAKKDRV
jgi:hypothetical protein